MRDMILNSKQKIIYPDDFQLDYDAINKIQDAMYSIEQATGQMVRTTFLNPDQHGSTEIFNIVMRLEMKLRKDE